jgi:hypothetical protein
MWKLMNSVTSVRSWHRCSVWMRCGHVERRLRCTTNLVAKAVEAVGKAGARGNAADADHLARSQVFEREQVDLLAAGVVGGEGMQPIVAGVR